MYNFNKKQKIAIGIILVVLAIIVISYVYSKGNTTSANDEILEENIMQENKDDGGETNTDSENIDSEDQIIVHIAGAVNQEGIVYLKEGARINEAIEKAGGTTAEADMSQVNLAYELEDGMKIYIPKKGEIMDENADQDYLVNFSTREENTENSANSSATGTTSRGAGSSASSSTSAKTSAKININKANQAELETLPGIGSSTAQKIIAHRNENGKFDSIESIKDVSGIGDAKYESIKDLITVK